MHKQGLVFGKFLPLHAGHIALIEFARKRCQTLTICVCASDKEKITADVRCRWLQQTYENEQDICITSFDYKEDQLTNTSVSSHKVSKDWSDIFKNLFPEVDCVFSSEKYGDYVADYMGISHISFDIDRTKNPISATQLNIDLLKHWESLSDAAKPYFQRVIAISGTESTGKSTLAKYLSEKLESSLVSEVGREIVPHSSKYSVTDLMKIASLHAQNIETSKNDLNPFVILDTDVYITQSYCYFQFGKYLELDENIYTTNKAALRLYLSAKNSFIQDGTRMDEVVRNQLDVCHRNTLVYFDQDYLEMPRGYSQCNKEALLKIRNLFSN